MFSRKKAEQPKKKNHNISQFGLLEIPDDFDPALGFDGGGDECDSDLEAELVAITSGDKKIKRRPKTKLMPPGELDKMIADSLKDVDDSEMDEDVDINDPDLLGELHDIAGVTIEEEKDVTNNEGMYAEQQEAMEPYLLLPTTAVSTIDVLKQRIEMYKLAEANAKAQGELAKVRRFSRGLKTINDLLRQANAGETINPDDIPPEVSVKTVTARTTTITNGANEMTAQEDSEMANKPRRKAPEPPPPEVSNKSETLPDPRVEQMRTRQKEYKAAALQAKGSGDKAMALQYLKVVKQFDIVVQMCIEGKEVDLSDMPPPPSEFKEFLEKMHVAAEGKNEEGTKPIPLEFQPETQEQRTETVTVLEALEQRLNKYKSVEASAKAEDNASKARRFGRIVKQYEEAIRAHKAGRTVSFDELPVPPGFGPLPLTQKSAATPPTPPQSTQPATEISAEAESEGTLIPLAKKPTTPRQVLTTRTSGNQQKNNLAEQQMKILLERQSEFRKAAIEAKKAGEMDQAKEYLKIYKGFDALVNAASSGLPVDLSTLPIPPNQRENLEASFAIVTTEDCDSNDDIADIRIRVEEQLAKQLMMCKNTRDHHKAMGDIAGMNRFENLALSVQKDLDLVRFTKRKNLSLPKFHYEKRSFNIVHCNTDLTDNEMEIVVVRGLNYNVPNAKEVDTYVKIECPLLNEESFKAKTNLIKDTDSPEYEQRFQVDIIRANRQFNRIFKRYGVKFEVYSRGCSLDCCGLSRILPICCFRGFLRSDNLIGTITVKLQPLETKCDIHDTFNLMDGRKVVGGKLEIKIRLRNPILTKQLEHLEEKWLVLDA